MHTCVYTYQVSVSKYEVAEMAPDPIPENLQIHCCRHPAVRDARWGPIGSLRVTVMRDPDYQMMLGRKGTGDPKDQAQEIVERLIKFDDSVFDPE